jgi:hypothetical protein
MILIKSRALNNVHMNENEIKKDEYIKKKEKE